jgi:catechol 2,3-dioxygenase-like lactoylglutathione lyase family enzyme
VIGVERTDFVSVVTRDLDRARAFYAEALGLRTNPHAAEQFDGETIDTGVCHMAFFSDPDGNALMLHRRYAPFSDGSQP